jgi:hypothetical protein
MGRHGKKKAKMMMMPQMMMMPEDDSSSGEDDKKTPHAPGQGSAGSAEASGPSSISSRGIHQG